MTDADQIEQQAENLKSAWFHLCRLRKRVEIQQCIIDTLRRQLDDAKNPASRAEAIFRKGAG